MSNSKVVHVATEERPRTEGMIESFLSHDPNPRFFDAIVTTDDGRVVEATSTTSMAEAIESATNEALGQ